MAITNSANLVAPGGGTPILVQRVGITVTSGTGYTVPSSGSLAPTGRTALLRMKLYTGTGTSPTVTSIAVTCTDGTTTGTVFSFNPIAAATLAANNIVDVTTPEMALDFAGVTTFTVTPTLGGTSPGCQMDIEVCYCN